MSKLVNLPIINQKELLAAYNFGIRYRKNILVFGPSGAGKTEMAIQAIQEAGYEFIYWNMTVMERPDIQGLPTISHDRTTSTFAPQEGVPFIGHKDLRKLRILKSIVEACNKNLYFQEHINAINDSIAEIEKENLKDRLVEFGFVKEESKKTKYVLFLDEIDKAPQENQQPLLELLQSFTINGNKINIQTIFLTANLPDEQTFSEPLSHALTARCQLFELLPDAKIFLEYAESKKFYPSILAFLSREENSVALLNDRPKNNEMYGYAYTSPRHWYKCSVMNYDFDQDVKNGILDESLRHKFNASIIGEKAATQLDIWTKYFKRYSYVIEAIFNEIDVDASKLNDEKYIDSFTPGYKETLDMFARHSESSENKEEDTSMITIILCFALSGKLKSWLLSREPDLSSYDTEEGKRFDKVSADKVMYIVNWLKQNATPDVQNACFRTLVNHQLFIKHGIHFNKDFIKAIEEINEVAEAVKKSI